MDTGRISTLLQPFLDHPLAPAQLRHISTYIDLLLRWNARINLTAVRDPESIVTRHFGESLFLARHLLPDPENIASAAERRKIRAHGASRGLGISKQGQAPLGAKETDAGIHALDIGSGAGFPALPLKIWAPNISLTMIESNQKKAAFLREVSRALTLTDINVMTQRAEVLAGRLPAADLVTLRAVEHFQGIVPIATRFLAPAGRLAFLIGASQMESLASLTPGLSWLPFIPIPDSASRVVAISAGRT